MKSDMISKHYLNRKSENFFIKYKTTNKTGGTKHENNEKTYGSTS